MDLKIESFKRNINIEFILGIFFYIILKYELYIFIKCVATRFEIDPFHIRDYVSLMIKKVSKWYWQLYSDIVRYDAINKLELKHDELSKNIYLKFNMTCIYIKYILNTYISLSKYTCY